MTSSRSSSSKDNPYQVRLSLSFLLTSLVSVVAIAFGVGYSCRVLLFNKNSAETITVLPESRVVRSETLPPPVLSACKDLPNFVYTSKHFETGSSATSDNLLVRHEQQTKDGKSPTCPIKPPLESEDHQPAGQHLLVDIKNVDGLFLNSESQLAQAMVELVADSGLTLLSYHCHTMEPIGVSCAGILLESHVSFHTWPIEGVITFDLFTCGPKSLMPLLPEVEKLFGVPRKVAVTGGAVEAPHVQWSYKLRGYRTEDGVNPEETTDMNQFMLGWMEFDMKRRIANVDTDFQNVQVFEIIDPRFRGLDSYKRSLSGDTSYEAANPKLFQPDRIVYLDHIMQSRLFGEAAYHEALVHPALISHPNPKRVAIIGGGEGATMREVLKHKTVEKVTMVEIDEVMVEVSRKYLPEWSDCSVIGHASCFDDPRAEAYYTDAIAWFIERYGSGDAKEEDKYDLIIMDALDPSSAVSFSDILYDNDAFANALTAALTDDGIMVAQVGEEDGLDDPPKEFSKKQYEFKLMTHLQNHGFQAVKDYSESHGGFLGIWRFIVAFKDKETLTNWNWNEAEVNLAITKRMMSTTTGESPLRFFDGAIMMGYQFTSRVSEEVFCRSTPQPDLCAEKHGLDPFVDNVPITSLEVRQSSIPNAGRGVFFKEPVSKGQYMAVDELVHSILVMPWPTFYIQTMQTLLPTNAYFKTFNAYLHGYGYAHDYFGDVGYSVEPSILTFINHGCNHTYVQGLTMELTEMTVDAKEMPDSLGENVAESSFYNPCVDRNHMLLMHAFERALRDIAAGEELLDNYLNYYTEENWESAVADLRAQCSSQGVGAINRYEDAQQTE